MPTSRGLSAGSSDVARFLDTAHKARYVEIFESQVLKTAKSSRKAIKSWYRLIRRPYQFGIHFSTVSMAIDRRPLVESKFWEKRFVIAASPVAGAAECRTLGKDRKSTR